MDVECQLENLQTKGAKITSRQKKINLNTPLTAHRYHKKICRQGSAVVVLSKEYYIKEVN